MASMIVVGILLLFGMIGLMVYLVGTYNTFVRLSNNIDKGWSNIDVILKQRHDELPKLVEVCNSYMIHERATLEAVTKARAAYGAGVTVDEKARAENRLANALDTLFAVAEQYPDLKANEEFLHEISLKVVDRRRKVTYLSGCTKHPILRLAGRGKVRHDQDNPNGRSRASTCGGRPCLG